MADIVFRYKEMRSAADEMDNIATRYQTSAETFENDFLASISSWEGESKEKMQKFVTGTVREYIHETIPQLVKALAELLRANADQMESADRQIAENIPE